MLKIVDQLFKELENKNIACCHWKSNASISDAVKGVGDLDLLVAEQDRCAFQSCLGVMGFRSALKSAEDINGNIRHYFAFDAESTRLVHLHVYYALETGGAIKKDYHFPVEEYILKTAICENGIKIPQRQVEYVLLVVRKTLERRSFLETYLLRKQKAQILREMAWLRGDSDDDIWKESLLKSLKMMFPEIDEEIFIKADEALVDWYGGLRAHLLGIRFMWLLRKYRIRSGLSSMGRVIHAIANKAMSKIVATRKKRLEKGGAVIAMVGPEASGKSTLIDDLQGWLGQHFEVETVHVGRPPATVLTKIPRYLKHIIRRKLLDSGKVLDKAAVVKPANQKQKSYEYMKRSKTYSFRCLLLAHERKRLLSRAKKKARDGVIILCDRYPCLEHGFVDGPQIEDNSDSRILRLASKKEKACYKKMPHPDVIVRLNVDVDTAVKRNEERNKSDKEAGWYVRERYGRVSNYDFVGKVIDVFTGGDLRDARMAARQAVWRYL